MNFTTDLFQIAIWGGIALGCASPSHAAPARLNANARKQAFVKINDYYLLYSNPVVPFISKNGSLMVGLDGLAKLLFYTVNDTSGARRAATLEPGKRPGTAIFSDNGHTVELTLGSRVVTVDGHKDTMASAVMCAGVGHELIVPLAAIAKAVGLDAQWDAVRRVMSIKTGSITDADGDFGVPIRNRILTGENAPNSEFISPVAIKLSGTSHPYQNWLFIPQTSLTFQVRNERQGQVNPTPVWIPMYVCGDGGYDFVGFPVQYMGDVTGDNSAVPDWKSHEARQQTVTWNTIKWRTICRKSCRYIVCMPFSRPAATARPHK